MSDQNSKVLRSVVWIAMWIFLNFFSVVKSVLLIFGKVLHKTSSQQKDISYGHCYTTVKYLSWSEEVDGGRPKPVRWLAKG